MLVVLDSTVLIDALRGRPAKERIRRLHGRSVPATTAVNVEEVVRGMRDPEEPSVRELFMGLQILPVDAGSAWQAGIWRRDHAVRGLTLWQADCLVAAVVQRHDALLVTGNPTDFPMPELQVEHWPVGQ